MDTSFDSYCARNCLEFIGSTHEQRNLLANRAGMLNVDDNFTVYRSAFFLPGPESHI